jgi:catechol 2,3-dioxygenase-like lactoylglutathione lyase family enzyme
VALGGDYIQEEDMIGRRRVVKGLAFAAGGALVGNVDELVNAQGTAIVPAMTINHVNLGVADVKRSADYYAAVLGGRPQASAGPGPAVQTMYFPGARPGIGLWASIGSSGGASRKDIDGWDGTPGVITHVGYGVTVPPTDFPRLAAAVQKRFPGIKDPSLFKTEAAGQECMIFDPDGIPFQLIPVEHNGTLKGYSKDTGLKNTGADGPQDMATRPHAKAPAIAPAMSLNHLAIDVLDLKRSMEFYAVVLGATPRYTWTYNKMHTMTLPGDRKGLGCWISLNEVGPGKRTGYNHIAWGLDEQSDMQKIAADISKAFPVDKTRFPDKKDPTVYKMVDWPGMDIYDPDGINLQLFQAGYDGELPKTVSPPKK